MADNPPVQWNPPSQIASGDTLNFQLNLPLWKPSDGWTITLTVTQPIKDAGQQVFEVVSTPDATNSYHTFDVQNFLAAQVPGDYIMAMQISCAPTGVEPNESHQIYVAPLKLLPNFAAGQVPVNIETSAQRKLRILDETYEDLARRRLKETDVQRTRILTIEIDKILDQIKYWTEKRLLEKQEENAKNGRPVGNVIRPIFNIGF